MNAGRIDNSATATGTPPSGPAVSGVDSVTALAALAPSITLQKTASRNNVSAVGQTVTYSFLVTNTGNVTLTGVGVTDPMPGLSTVNCPLTSLDPGASTTCTASRTVTQDDLDAGSIVNTATAHGTPPTGADVADTDSETVTAAMAPAIQILKTALPTTVMSVGDAVAYTFVVTNTGNATLTGVTVTDPLPGLSPVSCPLTTLAPADAMTCSANYTVTQADLDAGVIRNTAAATGTPPSAPAVSDTDQTDVDRRASGGDRSHQDGDPDRRGWCRQCRRLLVHGRQPG